eukprot:CAMPEP_0171180980 /NCGR_PEP_ID=MMETSP0790-20130122/14030_1 /TAXON_ID=2925 /ORGANISM="Alexandrium catenella, Strain OF101" /LENGTH=96 /DNA_ID=CAMNT_0011645917 /DNA_START=64 /DNA_END=354 /DNA_ORIENTATION=+
MSPRHLPRLGLMRAVMQAWPYQARAHRPRTHSEFHLTVGTFDNGDKAFHVDANWHKALRLRPELYARLKHSGIGAMRGKRNGEALVRSHRPWTMSG